MKARFLIAGLTVVFCLGSMICRAEDEAAPGPPDDVPTSPPQIEAMSAEFMQKVMETSARIEAMKKDISEREQFLYENHPEVKALRSQIIEIQKTINRILGEDEELARLKMDRDIQWSLMPAMPRAPMARPMPPGLMRRK